MRLKNDFDMYNIGQLNSIALRGDDFIVCIE